MAKINGSIKKEIGRRFRRFRDAIGKTQTQLAKELEVYQSTITNIEVGKTFPGVKYLHYFHHKYRLNTNWLMSDKGDLFITEEEKTSTSVSLLNCHVQKQDITYKKYVELMNLMEVPVVEQVILAKLMELKVLAKDEIEKFQEEKEKRAKLRKA